MQKPDKLIFLIVNQAFDHGKKDCIPMYKNDTISTGETVFNRKRTYPFSAKAIMKLLSIVFKYNSNMYNILKIKIKYNFCKIIKSTS